MDRGLTIAEIFSIDLYYVSGHLDQFQGSSFYCTKLIILVEWVKISPFLLIFLFYPSLMESMLLCLHFNKGAIKKDGVATKCKVYF